MRLPSLISRFERDTQSRDPFGVREVMQIAEPESTRDDAHPIATSIASVGRMKRLLKIADEMQPELERDQPFARMVARVGKLDADAVLLGFALIAAASRSDPHPDTDPLRSPRSRCHVRSIRLFAALSNKRIRVDHTPNGNFAAVLIDGPKPNQ